jgi:phosphate transport system permease protein
MDSVTIILVLTAFAGVAFYVGRSRALATVGGRSNMSKLHSLPGYYGYYSLIWCVLPPLALGFLWLFVEPRIIAEIVLRQLPQNLQDLSGGEVDLLMNNVRNLAAGYFSTANADPLLVTAAEHMVRYRELSRDYLSVIVVCLALIGLAIGRSKITPTFRARNGVESVIQKFLILASSIAILTTIGIVLSMVFEAIRFFDKVPLTDFLFGLNWSPQTAIRADQVGSSGSFGAVPLFAGTLLITALAMAIAAPVGLMTAIFLAEYASQSFRSVAKPLLEILAGIPTVVYGFFAALTVAPLIRSVGTSLGLSVASDSALAAGLVMGIMIIPLVSSLADDAINAVPQAMRDGALGLGSTKSEAIRQVVLPAALPGIVGGLLLAISRAIGETMIVVMAAGLAANLTANPFQAVTTVTVQIVTLLVGDQEFDSAKTLAAFALGLVLFFVTLGLNLIGLKTVRRYREQYE